MTDVFLLWQSRAVALNLDDTMPHYLVIITLRERNIYNDKLFRKIDNSTWVRFRDTGKGGEQNFGIQMLHDLSTC